MTDLDRAGRLLVARELVPLTPVERIRDRATVLARQRARRRRGVIAVAAVVAVLVVVAAWALVHSTSTHEHVATTPAPVVTTTTATTPSTGSPSTTVAPVRGVTAARLTRADLGMAATYDGASGRARLWLTRDTRTWQDVTPRAGIRGQIDDVFALDPSHLWAASFECGPNVETAWRSADGGVTWQSSILTTRNCSAGSTAHLQFVDASHGWAAVSMPNGPLESLMMTTDGGATWATVDPRLPRTGDVMFYTRTDGYLGGSVAMNRPFGDRGDALYVTHDGGRTWRKVVVPLDDRSWPNPSWTVIYGVPTFVDSSDGVLPVTLTKANTALVEWWTTADGGVTWHLSTPPTAGVAGIEPRTLEPTAALTSVTGPHAWWVVDDFRGTTETHRTTDVGAHWTHTDDTRLVWPSPTWFGAANADVAWVLGTHLYATTDGGHTWTQVDPPA
ncbi:MAG TPA: hypothetical protein VMT43_08120 [Acidimicrobiales bacterium]|nr:hypothetical protein [Acidimicrobiales bacterium]